MPSRLLRAFLCSIDKPGIYVRLFVRAPARAGALPPSALHRLCLPGASPPSVPALPSRNFFPKYLDLPLDKYAFMSYTISTLNKRGETGNVQTGTVCGMSGGPVCRDY